MLDKLFSSRIWRGWAMDGDVRECRVITWSSGGPQVCEFYCVSAAQTRVFHPDTGPIIFPHTRTLNDQNQSNSQQRK